MVFIFEPFDILGAADPHTRIDTRPSALSTCVSRSSIPVPFLALTATMGVEPPHSSATRFSSRSSCGDKFEKAFDEDLGSDKAVGRD